jgi:hypothetical protein
MELFNRDSRKTPVAQPFLAVGPCRTSINFFRSPLRELAHRRSILKPLLSILVLAILVEIGPAAVNALARTSLVLLQVFLGLCQLSLTIFQIFGM